MPISVLEYSLAKAGEAIKKHMKCTDDLSGAALKIKNFVKMKNFYFSMFYFTYHLKILPRNTLCKEKCKIAEIFPIIFGDEIVSID